LSLYGVCVCSSFYQSIWNRWSSNSWNLKVLYTETAEYRFSSIFRWFLTEIDLFKFSLTFAVALLHHDYDIIHNRCKLLPKHCNPLFCVMFVFCPRSDAAYKAIPPNRHGYGHITCFKIMGLLIISGMIKLKNVLCTGWWYKYTAILSHLHHCDHHWSTKHMDHSKFVSFAVLLSISVLCHSTSGSFSSCFTEDIDI